MTGTTMMAPPGGAHLAQQDYGRDKIELIKKTVAVGATDTELELFLYQCKRTGLDPLARQIYCIKRGNKATIQTGIDGYRLIADRTGLYAGNDDPVFEDAEGGEHPHKATVTVWKLVGNQRCGFTATARWNEYRAEGPMWTRMPYLMLGKVAEALALRKAFPADLSGVYTEDEMAQAEPAAAPAPGDDRTPLWRALAQLRAKLQAEGVDVQAIEDGLGGLGAEATAEDIKDYGRRLKAGAQTAQGAAR